MTSNIENKKTVSILKPSVIVLKPSVIVLKEALLKNMSQEGRKK